MNSNRTYPLFKYEKELLNKGVNLVAGVDEVGRGPLAGPMVVCAAICNIKKIHELITKIDESSRNNDVSIGKNQKGITDQQIYSNYTLINDSKRLSDKIRRQLNDFLRLELISYSLVEISNTEIDTIGISNATQKAFYQAIKTLNVVPEHILTDTFEIKLLTKDTQTNIIKGDSLSISIAAASIMAKVYRDTLMLDMHKLYPQYGFDQHKGYGTKKHIEAIQKYGPCGIHRKSFEPIKSM